jgi:hypothetical protein
MKNASDYTDEEANDMTEIELEMYREAVDEAEAALAEIESVNQTGTARHPYLSETPGVTCISMFCVSLSPVFISHKNSNYGGEFVAPEIYEIISEAGLEVVDVSPVTQHSWDKLEKAEVTKEDLMLWCTLER